MNIALFSGALALILLLAGDTSAAPLTIVGLVFAAKE